MSNPLDTIVNAAVDDVERRGQSLSKQDWYRLLDRMRDELAMRLEAVSDELRELGIDPRELPE